MKKDDKLLSRREFLQAGVAITSVAGIAMLGAACNPPGSKNEGAGGGKTSGESQTPVVVGDNCLNTSGLTDAELKTREQLKYVDRSPVEGKTCDNCSLFVPPEAGKNCGGCKVLKGPVHPKGYCTAWAAKA